MKHLIILSIVMVLTMGACSSAATSPATIQAPATTAPPTSTSLPSDTPRPSATPHPPTETPIPPTITPVVIVSTDTAIPPTLDMREVVKSAKIIVFEDMSDWRYIKEALDKGGYTYTDVSDRLGSFKKELQPGTKWDLIIAAAEGRGGVSGEFFDYLNQQLDDGASVIMELWTLDYFVGGRVQPIMDKCEIQLESNWVNPSNRAVYWVDGSSPIANEPNVVSAEKFINFWEGDVGDLVSLAPGSSAKILASANQPNAKRDGLLTECFNGHLLLQTFSTHDHLESTMVQMWQNYIYHMLSNRYK